MARNVHHSIVSNDIIRRIAPLSEFTLANIPARVGLFPLSGVVLLPEGRLPFNIFEPRYVALLEDALAQQRLIGLIQPRDTEDTVMEDLATPSLHEIGTLGRIVEFSEHANGTFTITLQGVARFRLLQDTVTSRGWREGAIDASAYVEDMMETHTIPVQRDHLLRELRTYLDRRNVYTDWTLIEDLDTATLLIVLPMLVPFSDDEKQLLLEAARPEDRASLLLVLFQQSME